MIGRPVLCDFPIEHLSLIDQAIRLLKILFTTKPFAPFALALLARASKAIKV